MSAEFPKIKVETEESSRPTLKIKNPTSIKGVDIIGNDDDSSSVSTIEQVSPVKKTKSKN